MAIFSDDDKTTNRVEKTKNPLVKTEELEYDKTYENTIRPKSFDEYIGQSVLKENLKISIEAAKLRETSLDHLLFYGPPGLGKTTLAMVIANQMGADIKITSAPSLERPRDIIGLLMSIKSGSVLFIDEIHRLNKISEEILYPAMEDFALDMTSGKSQTVQAIRVPIPKFTLIGATTKAGALSGPLRDRFGIIHRLQFYTLEELTQVIKRTAQILGISITEEGAEVIARASRGTPRIANRLIKRVSDFALIKYDGVITGEVASDSLSDLNIDEYGLDTVDRQLLSFIINQYDGGPVGIETLATALSEDVKTIEDVYEPYLMQLGLIQRTPRGRKISPAGYRHMGIKLDSEQQSLF